MGSKNKLIFLMHIDQAQFIDFLCMTYGLLLFVLTYLIEIYIAYMHESSNKPSRAS